MIKKNSFLYSFFNSWFFKKLLKKYILEEYGFFNSTYFFTLNNCLFFLFLISSSINFFPFSFIGPLNI